MVLKFKDIDYSNWSKGWKSSKQPRKQRKYLINAPIHIRRKIMCSALCKKIREVANIKSIPIRVGDYVRVLRGKFKNTEGFVIKIDAKRYRIFLDKVKYVNKSGKETYYPIHHSKVEILKLNLSDRKRIEILNRKIKDQRKIEDIVKNFSVSEDDIKKAKESGKNI